MNNTDNTTEAVEITIPPWAFVPCPQRGFKNIAASRCVSCSAFGGLQEVTEAPVAFDARYRVICSFPIARRLIAVELEGAHDSAN